MRQWLVAFAFDWCAIAASVALVEHWPLCLPLALIVIGTRQHALGVLGHDGTHHSISRNRALNQFLTYACFVPLGIDPARYRVFHLGHHRHLNTSLDPEFELKTIPAWALPASRRRIVLLCARDFLMLPALLEILQFMRLAGSPVATGTMLTFWTLVTVFFGWWPIALWFGALSTAFWSGFRMRVWTEHMGGGTHCVSMTWWQRFLFAPHNISWHCEHHEAPGVPFHLLPALRHREPTKLGTLLCQFSRT